MASRFVPRCGTPRAAVGSPGAALSTLGGGPTPQGHPIGVAGADCMAAQVVLKELGAVRPERTCAARACLLAGVPCWTAVMPPLHPAAPHTGSRQGQRASGASRGRGCQTTDSTARAGPLERPSAGQKTRTVYSKDVLSSSSLSACSATNHTLFMDKVNTVSLDFNSPAELCVLGHQQYSWQGAKTKGSMSTRAAIISHTLYRPHSYRWCSSTAQGPLFALSG